MAQSTNDVIPTAIRLGVLARARRRSRRRSPGCAASLAAKGEQFDDIIKAGRTHLQDAMPIRLGQEFAAWAGTIERAVARGSATRPTTCATWASAAPRWAPGVNVEPEYPALMVKHLRAMTGLQLRAGDRIQLMQSMGDVASFSAALRVARARSLEDRQRPAPAGERARAPASTRSCCPRCSRARPSCRARSIRRSPRW